MLERLKAMRDKFDELDRVDVTPSPFWHYKFADVVFDLCRDFDARLTEIERRFDAQGQHQQEQGEQ